MPILGMALQSEWYLPLLFPLLALPLAACSGGTVVLQDSGGNVGIGTTNPQYLLSVNGTIGAKPGWLPLSVLGVENTDLDARTIVEKALNIAGKICIYTNTHITVLEPTA